MDEVIADLARPHAPDEHKNELLAGSSLAPILAAVPRGDKTPPMPRTNEGFTSRFDYINQGRVVLKRPRGIGERAKVLRKFHRKAHSATIAFG
jgi:hypothetical protein